MDWKLEDNTGTNKGYLRITCDGEPAADVFPFAAGRDPAKVTERAKEMVATLNGFAHPDLLTWMERALEHFDRAAEGGVIIHDPADLYAEGIVCFRRLSHQPQKHSEPMTSLQNDIDRANATNRTLQRRVQQIEGVWESAMAEAHKFAISALGRAEAAQHDLLRANTNWCASLRQREVDYDCIRNLGITCAVLFVWGFAATVAAIYFYFH